MTGILSSRSTNGRFCCPGRKLGFVPKFRELKKNSFQVEEHGTEMVRAAVGKVRYHDVSLFLATSNKTCNVPITAKVGHHIATF